MLGVDRAAKQCQYVYPEFSSVKEFVAFNTQLTRWGEAGYVLSSSTAPETRTSLS